MYRIRSNRQMPSWQSLLGLLQVPSIGWQRLELRLGAAATIADLRTMAKRRVPKSVFDYVDGAADTELGLAEARDAYARVRFQPKILRDVGTVQSETVVFGRRASMPLIFAPAGVARLLHPDGECAVARVAERVEVPYVLSTMASTSFAETKLAAPSANIWFQLYIWRDRAASERIIERVAASGCQVLVLTVDTPVTGSRIRDLHNRMAIPPTVHARAVGDIARHPAWWFNHLTTPPVKLALAPSPPIAVDHQTPPILDPSLSFKDIEWLRTVWPGKLILKGVQRPDDARSAALAGVDAIIVSNHGGRQMDRTLAPLDALLPIVDAVGDDLDVYVDGGIMSGQDIVAAITRGAKAVLIGRAYLYGLMAGGEMGVRRSFDILASEFRRAQQLLGAPTLADLVNQTDLTARGSRCGLHRQAMQPYPLQHAVPPSGLPRSGRPTE